MSSPFPCEVYVRDSQAATQGRIWRQASLYATINQILILIGSRTPARAAADSSYRPASRALRTLGKAGNSKVPMRGRPGDGAGPSERLALQGFVYGAGKGTRTPDPLLGKPKARGTPVLRESGSALSGTGSSPACHAQFLSVSPRGLAKD